MTKPKKQAYCTQCRVDVSLQQEFLRCIEAHQCYSDDPCPLRGKFAPPTVQHKQQKGLAAPSPRNP